MFNKIVIANRGENALRIHNAAKELGIKTVAVYSEVDKDMLHLKIVDEAICIGEAPAKKSYLNTGAILSVAEVCHADAIHPGSSFLAENSAFAKQVQQCGLVFIGSDPDTIDLMNDRVAAITTMRKLGLPCIPGSLAALTDNAEENLKLAEDLGYPVIVKAAFARGGRAMRVAHSPAHLFTAIDATRIEALAVFGAQAIYMEKLLDNPRHIEIQVMADTFGNVIHLGDRDCSAQRWNKKIIEEAPAPIMTDAMRAEIGKKCATICQEIKFHGIGTIEFLYENGKLYFTEMNTRLQLGHSVTEQVTGIDLVKEQIKIAAGERLTLQQKDVKLQGHAIGARIYGEDPINHVRTTGIIKSVHAPGGPGIRFDTHIVNGASLPAEYDAFLAMLIANGDTRKSAINRMTEALDELKFDGIITNIPLLQLIIRDSNFLEGRVMNNYLEKKLGPAE